MYDVCEYCRYVVKTGVIGQKTKQPICCCSLTSACVKSDDTCEYCNKDLTGKDMCYNCKYYNGGHDCGLFCGRLYHHLGAFNDEPCHFYERKVDSNDSQTGAEGLHNDGT